MWMNIVYKHKELKYLINEYGDIVSLQHKKWKVRKFEEDKDGYYKVTLRINKKSKKFFVHRLVALMFCNGYSKLKVVNHKDGDKKNNYYTNLEWVFPIENEIHASKNFLKANGERNSKCKHKDELVHTVCKLLENGKKIKYIANLLNITYSFVWEIKHKIIRRQISSQYNF